jgi:hypothetical protein
MVEQVLIAGIVVHVSQLQLLRLHIEGKVLELDMSGALGSDVDY